PPRIGRSPRIPEFFFDQLPADRLYRLACNQASPSEHQAPDPRTYGRGFFPREPDILRECPSRNKIIAALQNNHSYNKYFFLVSSNASTPAAQLTSISDTATSCSICSRSILPPLMTSNGSLSKTYS